MFSKNNKLMNDQRKGEKITRYSIKKYSFGAASVAVAFGIYFANGPVVTAQEVAEATSTATTAEAPSEAATSEATPATPAVTESATTQPAAESATDEVAQSEEVATPAASTSEDQVASSEAPAASESEAPAQPATPARRTPGYAVNPVPTPSTSAMPRPTNQGQPLPQGTGFRDSGATGVQVGTGPAGADDATSTPRVPKPNVADSANKNAAELTSQIAWLDFGDRTALTNLDARGGFQIGTRYHKEISPGYVVTATVTELKPFNATDIYKKRVEGTDKANTYDPNATNSYLKLFNQTGAPGPLTGFTQNIWSSIQSQGIDTKNKRTSIRINENGVNWGVKFKIEATYRGKKVAPTVVMADGEEANPGEFGIFTTNGEGWEYLAEWQKGRAKGPYKPMDQWITGQSIFGDKSIDWLSYLSRDQVTGGLGSQVFGPNVSKDLAIPIVMTRGASEVAFYVASSGQQAAMMGFLIVDGSDAPASYGQAYHAISSLNSITDKEIKQPYLGDVAADVDSDTPHDWTFDDRKELADEGAQQLLGANQYANSNDLLDLNKAKSGSYTLTVKANPNGNAQSFVKAWVDFNGNGIFDENEGSATARVTAAGETTLTFAAIPGLTSGLVDQVGIRVRIATNASDIEKPTGVAFSGEVEDLLVRRIMGPQGDKQNSYGFAGEQQTATVHFTPRGANRTDLISNTTLTNQAPQVYDKNGTLLTPAPGNTYIRPEGTYVLTVNGNDVNVQFTPNASFMGEAEGINIRRTDSNGNTTDWSSTDANNPNVNDQRNNMDGRYVPTVLDVERHRSTYIQGQSQSYTPLFNDGDANKAQVTPGTNRPAQFLDSTGQPSNQTSLPALSNGQQVGTYTLNPSTGRITFQPNKTFVGAVDPITVEVKDENGVRHRAAFYPNVTRVTPTGQNASSEGIQGAEQSGLLQFNPGDVAVPIDTNVLPTFDNGQQTKTVVGVGTYTVDNTGRVTFQPLPGYTGRPTAETVKRVDTNGTEVTASYQAEVKAATPSGQNAQSTGLQGQLQNSHLTFTPGQATVNGQTETVPLNTEGPQFVVNGQVQAGNTLQVRDAAGKLQGTYTVQPNGDISFQPEPDFHGTPVAAQLRVTDKNGSTADATYQPEVTPVTPTGQGTATTGLQGQVQEGQVTFTPGNPAVPFKPGTTPVFDTGSNTKTLDGVGTFVVDATGKVTFTPDKAYSGQTPALELTYTDVNGTVAKATYQATVTKVTPTSTNATSSGPQGVPQTGTPTFAPGHASVPLDTSKPLTFDDGSTTKTVTGQGVYTINDNGSITFTPDKQYVGTPSPVTVKRVDVNGTEVTATYTPTVTKVTPTSTPATSTGIQGQPQKGTPTFEGGDPLVPIDTTKPMTFDNGTNTKVVPNEGTYTINSDGSITFTPEKTFVGKATPVTVERVDENGTKVTATYTPDVTKVTPTAKDATSTGIQGQPQKGTPTFEGGDPLVPIDTTKPMTFEDGSSTKVVPNEGTYTINPDGSITFTPEKTFVGKATPVTVERVDENGTKVTATYTPDVTKVTPTAKDATSTGIQGQPQKGTPTFEGGDPLVPIDDTVPMTFDDGNTTKSVPGVGEYVINPDGSITFTPDKQYVGTPSPVTVKRVDKNGTSVTATYAPEVTKVTPTAKDATSTGVQGRPQTGTPTFEGGDPLVPIDDTVPMTFDDGNTTKSVPSVGEYVINTDGSITFTPDPHYIGTPSPVTVKRVDKNGTSVTATYTPVVTKVAPIGENATSTGIQGQTQTGTPTFTPGDPAVPMDDTKPMTFDDGQTTKVVPNEGTYTINPDGSITFTPDKQFTGPATPVTVKRVDKNGTEATATYTPTVTAVTPTSSDATSTGVQGQTQTGKPVFTEGDPLVPIDTTVPMTFDDGTTTKTVPGVGTYTAHPDGSITFTPDKQYVGTPAAVVVKRVDKNGTTVTAQYTPTVTKVTPTGTDATSTGVQGQSQSGTPTFTPGDPAVPIDGDTPMTFDDGTTTKTVANVGTYVINSDGSITFTPEKQYVGTPAAVLVQRVDKNGTSVTAHYTPTVTRVTPVSDDASTTGVQGQVQTGTPVFKPGNPAVPIDETVPMTFDDGSTTKTVAGVGEYVINPDGSITFTPEKQYVGEPDPVTVKRVDKNGTSVTALYSVAVTRVTPTSTNATSIGAQGVPQQGSPIFKEGDPLVPIDADVPMTFEDGSSTKVVPNEGTYTINPDGSITFTPEKQFVGKATPVTVKRVDKNGTEVTATYTPDVTKVTPTSTPATSTGVQGIPQSGSPVFTPGDEQVPMDDNVPMTFDDGSTTKVVPNEGTYTINSDGSITFTPDKQFVGKATPVTVKRVDKNGTEVTATYTPDVTKVTPTSTPATSTGVQGIPQSGTPVFTPGDEQVPMDDTVPMTFEDGSTAKVVPNEGTYTINPDGSITFTPEKQFVGKATPVTVKRVDKNGTEVTATYTPDVSKVTPTSTPATSTGVQGIPQSGSPVFTPGDEQVPMDDTVPMTFEDGTTTKVVPNEGTYTINPDGSITFTPEKQFVGKATPVTVKRVDKNGTEVTATYTPDVTKVTPTGTDVTSTGAQGHKQSGTPVFTPGNPAVPIDATVPMTFEDGTTTKTVIGEGTYTIQADGTIEFVPLKTFVGLGSLLTVKRVDVNGTPVQAHYQVTTVAVSPVATGDYSTDVVDALQSGKVVFAPGTVTINGVVQTVDLEPNSLRFVVDGQAVTDTTIPALDADGQQVGTYTLAQDGTVTFTPNPGYVGQPVAALVQARDVNGTTAQATYAPVVNGTVTSTGLKGQPQQQTPDFNGDVDMSQPAYLDGGASTITFPGQGTYSVDPATGVVTFTPEPDFIGEAKPVVVVRLDVNGKELRVQYIPTVYGQVTTQDSTSTGYPGQTQTGTPVFQGDVDLSVPPTFSNGETELVVAGEGTYVLNPDGSITFTPEEGFMGQANGVDVIRVDRNGRTVTARYVPTVVPVPVEPVAPVTPAEPAVQQAGLLPATGEAPNYGFFSGVALTILASVGLVATRKREVADEE